MAASSSSSSSSSDSSKNNAGAKRVFDVDDTELSAPAAKRTTLEPTTELASNGNTEYYFWKSDGCSYTLDELHSIFTIMLKVSVPKTLPHSGHALNRTARTPHGALHEFWHLETTRFDKDFEKLVAEEVDAVVRHNTVIDKSRAFGHTECPLTCSEYDQPYLLNLNGRSYSKQAILDAIASTLQKGKSLRLEDCTIHFVQFGELVLFPNYSLPGWSFANGAFCDGGPTAITFHASARAVVHLPHDNARALANTFAEASVWLDSAIEEPHTVKFPDEILARFRERQHGFIGDGAMFDDLVLTNVVFPRGHFKIPSSIVFNNVHFVDCVINYNCFCSIKFYSCRFTRCYFLCNMTHSYGEWRACEYERCHWFFGARQCSKSWELYGDNVDIDYIADDDHTPIVLPNRMRVGYAYRHVYDAKLITPLEHLSAAAIQYRLNVAIRRASVPFKATDCKPFEGCSRYAHGQGWTLILD